MAEDGNVSVNMKALHAKIDEMIELKKTFTAHTESLRAPRKHFNDLKDVIKGVMEEYDMGTLKNSTHEYEIKVAVGSEKPKQDAKFVKMAVDEFCALNPDQAAAVRQYFKWYDDKVKSLTTETSKLSIQKPKGKNASKGTKRKLDEVEVDQDEQQPQEGPKKPSNPNRTF